VGSEMCIRDRLEALDQAQQARDLPQCNAAVHLLLADIYLKLDMRKEGLVEMEALTRARLRYSEHLVA